MISYLKQLKLLINDIALSFYLIDALCDTDVDLLLLYFVCHVFNHEVFTLKSLLHIDKRVQDNGKHDINEEEWAQEDDKARVDCRHVRRGGIHQVVHCLRPVIVCQNLKYSDKGDPNVVEGKNSIIDKVCIV